MKWLYSELHTVAMHYKSSAEFTGFVRLYHVQSYAFV